MNFSNSEKPLIMKFFPCTICILFNGFVPLNKENLQIMKKIDCPKTFIIWRYYKERGKGEYRPTLGQTKRYSKREREGKERGGGGEGRGGGMLTSSGQN